MHAIKTALTMVIDKSKNAVMKEIGVSEFRAKCFGILEEVRTTRRPIRVTRFGKPVAEVVPTAPKERPKRWFGSMAGTMKIRGDIVGPISRLNEVK